MTSASQELAALSLAELLDVYKRTVLERYATQHIGRANRLGAKRGRILKAIEQRANGTLHALLPLAEDADPRIRLAAASACKAIDRERYLRIAQELAERRDEIGREARDALHWDELLARTGPSQAPTVPRDAATSALPALPAGLGSADLEARLHEAFPTALADALLAKAQP